jgi:peptidyl-dipeptidase Dcp
MRRRTFLLSSAAAAALATFRRGVVFAKSAADPILSPWTGPYGGYPSFDKIHAADLEGALQRGIELHRAEIAALTAVKHPPDFKNTILGLEDAGRGLGRAAALFSIFTGTLADKQVQALEAKMAPILAAHDDEVVQNAALFARIKAVYDGRARLAADEQRLCEVVYTSFARQGAALGDKDKARLRDINQRLATLYTSFAQNQLADEESGELLLGEGDLGGLPESLKAAAQAAASAKGKKGWLISNTRSSMEPFLVYSTRRDLREKGWRMWISRGDGNDAHDNKKVASEILALRGEKARLLGFPTHAHWIIDDNMARTPDAALALLMKVWKPAVAALRAEIGEMQVIADAEKAGFAIEAWDYRHYAEKLRKAKYDVDEDAIKPYLQLDKMREAIHWAAGQLYGFAFKKLDGVPVQQPDVTVYQVTRNGKHVGLWYFDPYARDGKRSGAWMSEYRTQEKWKGAVSAIVSNNSNFVKAPAGAPVLISWDDANTMFHEFGHALHGLCSDVRFATLAGTNVKRDFVEFPSQLNEHWLPTKEVLTKFAVHHQSGQPIPDELVAKIHRAKHAGEGFRTVEYLASAIYDLKVHMAPGGQPIDVDAFEKQVMQEIGLPREVVMRHRPTAFGHIFSDDAYSAGYYVYAWADTLTADAAEAFAQAGSFYDKATAKRLYDDIMSVGNSIPPDESFRRFRGRDVDTNALMRDRGFPA